MSYRAMLKRTQGEQTSKPASKQAAEAILNLTWSMEMFNFNYGFVGVVTITVREHIFRALETAALGLEDSKRFEAKESAYSI